MNFLRNTIVAGCVAAASLLAAVDPTLLNLVSPDAKIISGLQVDQSKASPFGQYMLGRMTVDDPSLSKFIADSGFDPRRDLSEVLAASAGTAAVHDFVVLGKGVFNPAKIATATVSSGGVVSQYNGFQLISNGDRANPISVAFLDASTAVLGNTDSVKATIDRRTAGPKLDQATQNKIRDLAGLNHAWFLSTVPVSEFFAGKMAGTQMGQATGGNLFQAIRAAQGGVKFTTAGVQISGEATARSAEDATALADVIRFIAGLVSQNKDQNPEAAKFASILDGLQLSTQASTVKLSLLVPEGTAEQLFMPQGKAAARHRKATASVR